MQRHGKSLGFTLTCTSRPASEQPNSATLPERRGGGLGLCLLQGTSGSTWDLRQKHTDIHIGHRHMGTHRHIQGNPDIGTSRRTETPRHRDTQINTQGHTHSGISRHAHRDTQTQGHPDIYTGTPPPHTHAVTQTHTGPSSDSPVLSTAMLWSP